jgi:hypothetical protein
MVFSPFSGFISAAVLEQRMHKTAIIFPKKDLTLIPFVYT